MIKINLLAEGKKAVRAARAPAAGPTIGGQDLGTILLVLGVIAGAAAAWAHLTSVNNVLKDKARQIEAAQKEADELAAILEEVADYEIKKASLENKIRVIKELKANQQGPVRIMDEISRALPQLLWIETLELKARTIQLRGQAFNPNAVANFMDNLDKVPEFQEPVLVDMPRKKELYGFTVKFNYAPVVQAAEGEETQPLKPRRVEEATMALELNLKDKPWYVGGAIGLVLAIAIWGVSAWQLVTPKKKQIVKQERTLAELQEQINKGRAAKAKLPQFREEVRRLELELDKLLRILPARRNTADLLRRVRALTEQGDFDLKRFTPGGFSDRGFYSEWPLAVDLDGTYHNLALFFDRVSRFSRIINIGDLKISTIRSREVGEHTITASFRALTFVYKEDGEVIPADDGTGKGKKGRKGKKAAGKKGKQARGGQG